MKTAVDKFEEDLVQFSKRKDLISAAQSHVSDAKQQDDLTIDVKQQDDSTMVKSSCVIS